MMQLDIRCSFIACLLIIFLKLPLLAQSIFKVETKGVRQALYPATQAEYFEDKTGKLTFAQVQKQPFVPHQKSSINFGYTSSTFWVRLQLHNISSTNNWRLLSFIPYHNYLDCWQKTKTGTWQHTQTGWLRPFNSRGNFEHVGFVFPLDLPTGATTTIYFRLNGYDPLTFPLELLQNQTLDLRFQFENLYYGIYFGILAVMLLYNLFIYITLRDRNYLYYVSYILCMLIIFSSSTGYLFRYVHPQLPFINLYSSRITMGIIVITTGLFAIHFLELKKYILWFYKLFLVNIGLAIIAMLLTGTELYSSATNDLLSFHSPLLLLAGILAWRRGHQSARYYVIAWSVFLIGATTITLRNMGLLPINSFTTHTVEIGSAIEVILLSLALADKYRILRIEKEQATYRALLIQQKANEELEDKVRDRTREIQNQKEEITQQAETLKAINDELKKANILIKKDRDEKVKIYLQEATEATNKLQQIQETLTQRGPDIAQKLLTNEINTAGELSIIQEKVRNEFPDFTTEIDKALADKKITKAVWQVGYCLKMGRSPSEISKILPLSNRTVSVYGTKLRKIGVLETVKK
ncbi:MAG TPA: hypothetical protein DCS93_10730 [Microscillaceae bacterium]|nr:hypothetical protein [Microscillaceae bacterium]